MPARGAAVAVLAACFIFNMLGRGLADTYAVFLLPLEREFGWSRSELTGVYSVYLLVSGFTAPLVGLLFDRFGGEVDSLLASPVEELRPLLLGTHGVGPETADSILLYAAGYPVFVVDAYTRRVFSRLGLVRGNEPYDELQRFFMTRLPRDPALYNDYHAQIVRLGKDICRPQPRCADCPLAVVCPRRGV